MEAISLNPASVVTSRLRTFFRNTELALGTGFFYERGGAHYLITNWHVVSVCHPNTSRPLADHAGLPDRLKLTLGKIGLLGEWVEGDLLLYSDSEVDLSNRQTPTWLLHPDFHERVDVVAIPITAPAETQLYTINNGVHTDR